MGQWSHNIEDNDDVRDIINKFEVSQENIDKILELAWKEEDIDEQVKVGIVVFLARKNLIIPIQYLKQGYQLSINFCDEKTIEEQQWFKPKERLKKAMEERNFLRTLLK